MNATMEGYDGPIDLPGLSVLLDQAVTDFGRESDERQCAVRYHGDPVWFVRRKPEEGFFQQVQIAVLERHTDKEPNIFFTAFAYVATTGSTTRFVPRDEIISREVQVSKITTAQIPLQMKILKEELQLAWEAAILFKRSQVPLKG